MLTSTCQGTEIPGSPLKSGSAGLCFSASEREKRRFVNDWRFSLFPLFALQKRKSFQNTPESVCSVTIASAETLVYVEEGHEKESLTRLGRGLMWSAGMHPPIQV